MCFININHLRVNSKYLIAIAKIVLLYICFCYAQTAFAVSKNDVDRAEDQDGFYIGEYRVRGNTLLGNIDIERALFPYLGFSKTIKNIDAAKSTLQKLYHQKGYSSVLVRLPQQDIINGVVYLQVIEGRIDELRVTGSRYFSLSDIKQAVPALKEGQIPYFPDVQKQIADLNRYSVDRHITPVLRPGKIPGTLEVELKVRDRFPLHGKLEMNNRQSQNTSSTRLNAQVKYDNLWQARHSLSFQYQIAPEEPSEVDVLIATYLWRFADSNNILVAYGVKSDSETVAVEDLSVIGKGNILGLHFVTPIITQTDTRTEANKSDSLTPTIIQAPPSISIGLDFKDVEETIELADSDNPIVIPVKYINWAVRWSKQQRFTQSQLLTNISVNFGIRGVANDTEEFNGKRISSHPNYVYLRGDAKWEKRYVSDMKTSVRIVGQVSDSPLISNEQLSAGGAESVRGYFESQLLGDNVLVANFELFSSPISSFIGESVKQRKLNNELRFLAFVDAAHLRILEPASGQVNQSELYGVGLGLRMKIRGNGFAELDFASPLVDANNVKSGENRLHAKIFYQF